MDTEIWKDIIGYEGKYQVSSLGKVKSLLYNKQKILKPNINGWGYYQVALMGKKNMLVHRIVAKHFKSNPNNYPVVMHLDDNKLNNNFLNLEWGTQKQNILMMNLHGRNPRKGKLGKFCFNSKRVIQFDLHMNKIREWDSTMDIQRELFYNNASISMCCRGKYKTAYNFIWRYCN